MNETGKQGYIRTETVPTQAQIEAAMNTFSHGVTDEDERQRIMWLGLAATIRQRFPDPAADAEVDAQVAKERENEQQHE